MNTSPLRALAVGVLAVVFAAREAAAQDSPISEPRKAEAAELDGIVDTWVKNSAQIKTLSAKFLRHDHRGSFGHQEYLYDLRWKYTGKATIEIEAVVHQGKTTELERVVWTGHDVWQYVPRKKEVVHWSMEQIGEYQGFRSTLTDYWAGRRAGSQFDLILRLLHTAKGVDPLPFLIDMREIVAKKQFAFELAQSANPDQIVVRATPLLPEQKSLYDEVMITLDKERCLPVAIEYQRGRRTKDTRHYTLLEVQLDPPIDDSTFDPEIPKGWKVQSPSR
jgi:outer membrane lipoprotein-sorting protein